jgi:2-amino-4-hydroxy-6-hydroxymethyldihydropteridine diphosphokinase/tRNA threonylcarbamoyl adenosine modification protein YjeE
VSHPPPEAAGCAPGVGLLAALGVGANLGDRRASLDAALDALDRLPAVEILAVSSLHESAPWGDHDQDAFLNAAIVARTTLEPLELLRATQRIETRLGKRTVRVWGPRAIDIDLLLFGDHASATADLRLPHAHLRDRPFVYQPLAECLRGLGAVPGAWPELTEPTDAGRSIEADTRRLDPTGPWPSRPAPRKVLLASPTPESTRALGRTLGAAARTGDVFALDGPLGAGKTCLVHGLAEGLGITGPIPSPTYTLCREYTRGRLPFQHWDFYRLEGEGDLESTGFLDAVDGGVVAAVEWAGRFAHDLPPGAVAVRVDRSAADDTRLIALDFPPGSLALRRATSEWRPC